MMARILIICIGLATLLNGANFWLKKTGFLDYETHQKIVQQRADYINKVISEYEQLKKTNPEKLAEKYQQELVYTSRTYGLKLTEFYRSSPGLLIINKLAKYFVLAAILAYCLISTLTTRTSFDAQPIPLAFAAWLIISALVSVFTTSPAFTLTGIIIYSFLIIALFGSRLIDENNINVLIATLLACIASLILIFPIELIQSEKIHNASWTNHRVSGYMNLPNSMGIYLVCVYALISSLLQLPKNNISYFYIFSIVTLLGIYFTGSHTGVLSLMVFLVVSVYQMHSKSQTVGIFAILLFCCICFVLLNQTHDAWSSLLGRIYKLYFYFSQDLNVYQLLIGNGIGISSNLALSLSKYLSVDHDLTITTDSTPLALLVQIGAIGLALFYWLLIDAAKKDSVLRPAYIVFILCSLTINILEVFPLNILIGIMLAASFHRSAVIR